MPRATGPPNPPLIRATLLTAAEVVVVWFLVLVLLPLAVSAARSS